MSTFDDNDNEVERWLAYVDNIEERYLTDPHLKLKPRHKRAITRLCNIERGIVRKHRGRFSKAVEDVRTDIAMRRYRIAEDAGWDVKHFRVAKK